MTASRTLAAQFQSILDVIEEDAPNAAITESDALVACGRFQTVLRDIFLPRRITLRAESGNRLSVIARNRRVVAIAEVHPSSLWTADGEPQDAECEPDFETFGKPFAHVVRALVTDGPFYIDQHFVTDPLPDAGLSGYPASHLSDHLAQLDNEPQSDLIADFFDACEAYPRALISKETSTEIPGDSTVADDWLTARANEYAGAARELGTDLRFIVREGTAPVALACAWVNGLGCVIATDDPEQFDELETQLTALQASPQSKAVG